MATITVKNAANVDTPVELPNANGQTTMVNSRPVVLASDHTPLALTDGLAITTIAGGAVNAILFSVDTTGYRGVAFQLMGTFVATTTIECSNDNTTWNVCAFLDSFTQGYVTTTTTVVRNFYVPAVARYVRARLSAFTSGSVVSTASLRQLNVDPALISGTVTVGDRLTSAAADAATNTMNRIITQGYPMVFNGTTWDRARGDVTGAFVGRGGSSSLNISAATVIKATRGRIGRVSVITAGSTVGTINDVATTGGAAAANQVASIPNVIDTYDIDFPCQTGIVVVPGTGQTLSVSFV